MMREEKDHNSIMPISIGIENLFALRQVSKGI